VLQATSELCDGVEMALASVEFTLGCAKSC